MTTKDLELTRRVAPLDMSAPAFRTAGHDLVDRIADWLEQLPVSYTHLTLPTILLV